MIVLISSIFLVYHLMIPSRWSPICFNKFLYRGGKLAARW